MNTPLSAGSLERPWWCTPWVRVITCLLALVFAWWPHSVLLYFVVNSVEMGGYAIPFWVVSWIIGVSIALARRGDPASAKSERVVVVLAILPPTEFLVRASIGIAYFGFN